jgi:hypothetical protein
VLTFKIESPEAAYFDYQRLAKAIATREATYKLLMWISDAIDSGKILPTRAAQHSGGTLAATHWLRSCYYHIPEALRPLPTDIDEFAAFFSTYLLSSFDVVLKPGTKGVGRSMGGCHCEICLRIVNAPHLRAKKLYAVDKRRANVLMCDRIVALARENVRNVDNASIDRFADDLVANVKTRRHAAYLTYGYWLIQRLDGNSDGASILALWRIIAWDPRGGMRRNFHLKLDDFQFAEQVLLSELRGIG